MPKFRAYILALAVLAVASLGCTSVKSSIEKLGETARKLGQLVEENRESVKDGFDKAVELVNQGKEAFGQIAGPVITASAAVGKATDKLVEKIDKADLNGDGELSWKELWLLIAGGGGAGGILVRNSRSNKRKAELEAEVARIKGQMEAAMASPKPTNGNSASVSSSA